MNIFIGSVVKILDRIFKYDNYVPIKYNGRFSRFLTESKFYQRHRIKFWTSVCQRHNAFSAFYDSRARDQRLLMLNDEKLESYYLTGTAVIENALSPKAVNDCLSLFSKLDLSGQEETNYYQFDLKKILPDACEELRDLLMPFYKELFPNIDINHRFNELGTVQMRVDFSHDGVDNGVCTANWHPDRFCPTLNAIWFPAGASWGEFEKDVGDPLITPADIQYYINYRDLNSSDEALRDSAYCELGRKKVKFTVTPNTLVIGSHHIQHRRSPFKSPGYRIAVFVDHYNMFKMSDLLKS